MTKTNDQITNLDAELDGLSSPTTADTYVVSKDYDPDVVAASAARRALGGGGGGSSLPTNVEWDENVLAVHEAADSGPLTPILFRLKTLLASGLELSVRVAVYFTGAVTTYNDNGDPLLETNPLADGGAGGIGFYGATPAAQPSVNGTPQALADALAGLGLLASGPVVPTPTPTLDDVLTEGNDVGVNSIVGVGGTLNLTGPVNLLSAEDGSVAVLAPGAGASTTIGTDGSGVHTTEVGVAIYGPELSFFGATLAPQPTGVAVTAEAIHAALVSLGLITA